MRMCILRSMSPTGLSCFSLSPLVDPRKSACLATGHPVLKKEGLEIIFLITSHSLRNVKKRKMSDNICLHLKKRIVSRVNRERRCSQNEQRRQWKQRKKKVQVKRRGKKRQIVDRNRQFNSYVRPLPLRASCTKSTVTGRQFTQRLRPQIYRGTLLMEGE